MTNTLVIVAIMGGVEMFLIFFLVEICLERRRTKMCEHIRTYREENARVSGGPPATFWDDEQDSMEMLGMRKVG